MNVFLVSFANGEQSWVKGTGMNPSLENVWARIQRGDPLRGRLEQPASRLDLADADYGFRCIFNPAYVTDVAEYEVRRI
jgi:hypothetical protein